MTTTRTATTEKLEELHQRLTAQVEALVTGEEWKAMLDVASKLHRYSARNVILILSQRPEGVTRVCGYRRWQALGRQVRKGEQGIAILAPCVYRARPADEAAGRDAPEVARILRGFRVAYVWDPLSRELSRGTIAARGSRCESITPEPLRRSCVAPVCSDPVARPAPSSPRLPAAAPTAGRGDWHGLLPVHPVATPPRRGVLPLPSGEPVAPGGAVPLLLRAPGAPPRA